MISCNKHTESNNILCFTVIGMLWILHQIFPTHLYLLKYFKSDKFDAELFHFNTILFLILYLLLQVVNSINQF